MHLDSVVDDLADLLRNHGLDGRDVDARFLVPQHIHGLRGLKHHEAHGVDLNAGPGDLFEVAAELGDGLTEGFPGGGALHHEFEGALGLPDGPHAVVNTARAQAHLADFEAPPFPEENVLFGDAHVIEADVHVTRGAWSWPKTCMPSRISTPGVSFGTKICDCC